MERKPTESASGSCWLNRSILGIGLASLFSDVGHEMATAAMPALLASLGASSALLGLIEGTADGLSSFAKLFSGLYSDRLRRRKPLAIAGYFVTASAMASFAFATQWWHVLVARVGGWIGRGARSPVRNVLLTEATSPETYGRAFGLERAMDSAGAVIGPALSVLLVATIGLRPLFLVTLIPGLLAACSIMFLVREKKHEPTEQQTLWQSVRALPNDFRRYLVGVGIAGIGDFSKTLLILWATEAWMPRFGPARAATLAMTFYIGYNIVYTISCYVSGMLADHFAKHWVLAIGYSVAVIPATALLLPGDSLGKFAVVFAGAGLYMGVWETLENSTAATLLPTAVRGLGFGVLATVNGIGDFISSAAVGALWVFSPTWAMLLVVVSSLGGAAIIASTR
ncbi:MAG TPA: MFS transporter [Chthoniobacterales bacterium]|jgi:MFS family permease